MLDIVLNACGGLQEAFLKVETAFQERNLSVWNAIAEEFDEAKGAASST